MEPLIGFDVTDAWVGIGTFLILDLTDPTSGRTASLWVYLADWAVRADGHEVLASDGLPTNRDARLPVNTVIGRQFIGAARLGGDELHLEFSDGIHLEIWENRETYGLGADMLKIFRDDQHAMTLAFLLPLCH